jgi:hypothetical protein
VLVIAFGAFAEGYVMDRMRVPGDAAATAHRILADPGLWRLGVAADLVVPLLAVVGVWISYVLLGPVNRSLILLDVLLTLVSIAVESVSKLFLLLVLPILQGSATAGSFDPSQREGLAQLALQAHDITFDIALVFFGACCLVEGYLIFRSGYFPRLLGVVVQVAGLAYLVACFAQLFAPALADLLLPGILLVPFVGESAYCLWLLIRGVDVPRWNERVASQRRAATAGAA